MRRFTTPTLTLDIEGLDLTGWHTVTAIKQGNDVLEIENAPCEATENGSRLTIQLTQEQTGIFSADSNASVQVRFINENGYAGATNIKGINITPVLVGGVIGYE